MAVVTMKAPGIGTFIFNTDQGPPPPGAVIVSADSSPAARAVNAQLVDHSVPAQAIPSMSDQPVMMPAHAQSSGGSGSSLGGSQPIIYGGLKASSSGASIQDPLMVAQAQRAQQMAANMVWSNDPDVRKLEERSWNIYVQTGRWDTPEQVALHDQAEAIRKSKNPLYPGSGPAGPLTQADQNRISLPNVPADPAIGSIGTVAAAGIGAIILLALLKG